MNLQTSFLTPPFGFALFYLRSVAARSDYKDRVSGQTIPAVTTAQIYKGAIAFIIIQLIMVVAVIVFPNLAIEVDAKKMVDPNTIQLEAPTGGYESAPSDPGKDLMQGGPAGEAPKVDDALEAVRREMERDAKK
jgi:hypothetical protein